MRTTSATRPPARRWPWRLPARGWQRRVWQVFVAVTGSVLFVAGLVMLVLPGPGLLFMFAGLAVLATEFRFARRAQQSFGRTVRRWRQRWRRRRALH